MRKRALHGTVPTQFWVQLRILRELWAIFRILCSCLPAAFCCAARRPHADVWRNILGKVQDVGEEYVQVVKCKSHIPQAKRLTPSDSGWWISLGNDHADELAKAAAAQSPLDVARNAAWEQLAAKVKGAVVLAASLHLSSAGVDTQKPAAKSLPLGPLLPPSLLGHTFCVGVMVLGRLLSFSARFAARKRAQGGRSRSSSLAIAWAEGSLGALSPGLSHSPKL